MQTLRGNTTQGLISKYTIMNNETGKIVAEFTFVLKPETDRHARAALRAYAESVKDENLTLYADLIYWLEVESVQDDSVVRAGDSDYMNNGVMEVKRIASVDEDDPELDADGDYPAFKSDEW